MKILIINANYYNKISNNLVKSAVKILKKNNFKIYQIKVPGVLEIPISIKRNIKKFDGFIALGCVIKGETPHFDIICRSTFDAILNLSIFENKPITNGIITAINKKQAIDRSGIKKLKTNKGAEAAKAIVSTLKNGPKKI